MSTKPTDESPGLQEAIDELLAKMHETSPDTKEYAAMIAHLQLLYTLREKDAPKRVSPDTVAIIMANLAGILLILNFERLHVIATKALGFLMKLK